MVGLNFEDTRFGEKSCRVDVDETVGSRIASLLVGSGHGKVVVIVMGGCDAIHTR
jgi:hypothetical protein